MSTQTMNYPARRTIPSHKHRRSVPALGIAIGMVLIGAWMLTRPAVGWMSGAPTELPFVSQGVAMVLEHPARLESAAEGGSLVATVPPGSRVLIAGHVVHPAGWWAPQRDPVVRHWVLYRDARGDDHYGLLDDRELAVISGYSPRLQSADERPGVWTAPVHPEVEESGRVNVALGGHDTVSAATMPPAGTGSVAIPWLPETVARWRGTIQAAAERHGVAPELVAIVMLVESGGDPAVTSPAGARGLMQIMPGTARDIALRRGMADFDLAQLDEPATNIDFGAWYLAQQLAAFGQRDDPGWHRSVELAAAAYNGGPGLVGQHLTTGQPLYAETSYYRRWVGGMWRERAAASSATYETWLAAGGERLIASALDRSAAKAW